MFFLNKYVLMEIGNLVAKYKCNTGKRITDHCNRSVLPLLRNACLAQRPHPLSHGSFCGA